MMFVKKTTLPKGHIFKLLKKHKSRCYYCGCRVVKNRPNKDMCRDNTATVEHLITRHDIRRLLLSRTEYTVLACYSCNKAKAKRDYAYFVSGYETRQELSLFSFLKSDQ